MYLLSPFIKCLKFKLFSSVIILCLPVAIFILDAPLVFVNIATHSCSPLRWTTHLSANTFSSVGIVVHAEHVTRNNGTALYIGSTEVHQYRINRTNKKPENRKTLIKASTLIVM